MLQEGHSDCSVENVLTLGKAGARETSEQIVQLQKTEDIEDFVVDWMREIRGREREVLPQMGSLSAMVKTAVKQIVRH